MFHILNGVLDPHALAAMQETVVDLPYTDGRASAGSLAAAVKSNEQAVPSPGRDAVIRKAESALMAHPVFRSAARPKSFARFLVSRYEGGQTYGTHVDDALMGGARTDLSFTIFLSDPARYEGGELVVEDRIDDRGFKLNAGDALLYPSDTLHRVAPVTAGVRYAVVGWVTSHVRQAGRREILFDLDQSFAAEQARGGDRAQLDRLARTRSNLLRMWAD